MFGRPVVRGEADLAAVGVREGLDLPTLEAAERPQIGTGGGKRCGGEATDQQQAYKQQNPDRADSSSCSRNHVPPSRRLLPSLFASTVISPLAGNGRGW